MRASLLALAIMPAITACGDSASEQGPPPRPAFEGPATARPDVRDGLLAGREAPRSEADGGGRAWLEGTGEQPPVARVSRSGTWTVIFEAGPLGIAPGGSLFLQISPFWNWSTPQVEREDAPGYTLVSTEAEGVELRPRTLDQQLLGIEVLGRGLASGERVRMVYGAGPRGARADSYAEPQSRFWIAVDGDGDGARAVLEDSPAVPVFCGPAARLILTAQTSARPGMSVRLCAAILDSEGNAGLEIPGELVFDDAAQALGLPEKVSFTAADRGRRAIELTAPEQGVWRISAVFRAAELELVARSNPIVVSSSAPRILWADLHGHTAESDGTGSPEGYFEYARDVAALDVVALTDHDHWGILFLDEHPAMWERMRAAADSFDEPGRFLAVLGYEWTNWISGHRCVVYFGPSAEVHSSLDAATGTPAGLWNRLRGSDTLTIAHHTAGGPIALDWSIAPDPELEPVTEIVSVHGSSEAADSPKRIYAPVEKNFARDALDRGYRLGFIGSGDSHDGHPGLAHLGDHYPTSGLAAILSEDLTRESVLAAIKARRVYATTGERILLRFSVAGGRMGEVVELEEGVENNGIYVHVVGTAPIQSIEVIRSGSVFAVQDGDGSLELELLGQLQDLRSGEYVYVRIRQTDGGMAWSSPVFIQ
jgi:hypothetical protein